IKSVILAKIMLVFSTVEIIMVMEEGTRRSDREDGNPTPPSLPTSQTGRRPSGAAREDRTRSPQKLMRDEGHLVGRRRATCLCGQCCTRKGGDEQSSLKPTAAPGWVEVGARYSLSFPFFIAVSVKAHRVRQFSD